MAETIFTRKEIEQTLINLIRERAVALGYEADKILYPTVTAYKAARDAIKAGGKELIDIYGVGGPNNRGGFKYHRIWMNLRQYNNGRVTHWSDVDYIDTSGGAGTEFSSRQVFATQRSILYDIRTAAEGENQTEYERIMLDIVMGALGTTSVGYGIPVLTDVTTGTYDPSRRFILAYVGSQEIKNTAYYGRLITYEVRDVWLDGANGSWDTTNPTTGIVPLINVKGEGAPEDDPPVDIIDVEP